MHFSRFKTTMAMSAIVALLFTTPACQAMPVKNFSIVSKADSDLPSSINVRGTDGLSPAKLYQTVKDYFKNKNAYDPNVENKCTLYMKTRDGGNCVTAVACANDRNFTRVGDWNVCYLNGRQFFTYPDIGDFSIQYTRAGGINGNTEDGLHHPILRFANLNNWDPLDVQSLIANSTGPHGNLCQKRKTNFGRGIVYECGIPKLGTAAYGLSIFRPVDTDPGFTPGWCTMHVVQHQRNEYGVGAEYAFDVVVYDALHKVLASVQRRAIDPVTKTLRVKSHLPYEIEIEARGGDRDPVVFRYGNETWRSGDGSHQGNLGTGPRWGYEYGNREGDMGFRC